MLFPVLALLAGCFYVGTGETRYEYDSGQPWCDVDSECHEDEICNAGTCEAACRTDLECGGDFACDSPSRDVTDIYGCVERCEHDSDCKQGFECNPDGACR